LSKRPVEGTSISPGRVHSSMTTPTKLTST